MAVATTKHPVVLIHGVFGYGRRKPLWDSWSPYWPECALVEMRANHLIVDVGALSSDHDRACEAFYQLVGGRVDYGEQHSREAGHNRYGATFDTALHPHWSATNPVHLLGHSFGATTAIELYQLICQDAFGVGSSHEWVVSITSIAGPLSGTTLTHLFGLHDASMRAYTLGHLIGSSLGLWFKLHTDFPVLKQIFDYRMPQWECVTSYREVLSTEGRINMSEDLAVYNILPALRLERNSRLVYMDKVFLASVVTCSHVEFPIVEITLAFIIVLLLSIAGMAAWLTDMLEAQMTTLLVVMAVGLSLLLRKRMQQIDYAVIPSLHACMLLMNKSVQALHKIFDGFERHEWELNDGAVNIHSMLRTWTPASILKNGGGKNKLSEINASDSSDERASTASTASSLTLPSPRYTASLSPSSTSSSESENDSGEDSDSSALTAEELLASPAAGIIANAELPLLPMTPLPLQYRKRTLQRGRWYVHRVRKNHMAGTHFDADAPQLFRDLLRVVASEFETNTVRALRLNTKTTPHNNKTPCVRNPRRLGSIAIRESAGLKILATRRRKDPAHLRRLLNEAASAAADQVSRRAHPWWVRAPVCIATCAPGFAAMWQWRVFGYGRSHPAWGYFPPYWPEQKLAQLNQNHVLVDVGTASSDHDRACEMFYQLMGGTVDYGEEHAKHTTHLRYGSTFEKALHPNWSEQNPIHLVGHSLGALTALEFYQLVSADFFGVGSNHKWVRSITSIAGPLTGSTLTHMVGLHDVEMKRGSTAHLLYIVLGVWGKVYEKIPLLRGAYDLRMDQWIDLSLSQLCAVDGPVNKSMDSGFFSILPSRRVQLNSQLKHMDKLHLMSIVTSPKTCHVPVGEVSTLSALLLLLWGKFPRWWPRFATTRRFRGVLGFLLLVSLWRQVKKLDIAKLPSLYGLKWLMRRTVKALPQIFDGFEADHWEHNDGAVNIRSQLRPWFPKPQELSTATSMEHMDPHTRTLPTSQSSTALSTAAVVEKEQPANGGATTSATSGSSLPHCDSHISIHDFHRDAEEEEQRRQMQASQRFVKGRWYVYRVNSNHFTGTYWDREAGNLYKSLFAQIKNEYEYETEPVDDDEVVVHYTTSELKPSKSQRQLLNFQQDGDNYSTNAIESETNESSAIFA